MKRRVFLGLLISSLALVGCTLSPSQGESETEQGEKDNEEKEEHTHSWLSPQYHWSDDFSSCTATRYCSLDRSHFETETKDSKRTVKSNPTCDEDGEVTYTVEFDNPAFKSQTETEVLHQTGHDYRFDHFEWYFDGALAVCVCQHDSTHYFYDSPELSYVINTPATCTTDGSKTYTATYYGHQESHDEIIPKTGHKWMDVSYTWSDDFSTCTAEVFCEYDSSHFMRETVNSTYEVIKEPECTSKGIGRYLATFENPYFSRRSHDVEIDETGHDYEFARFVWDNFTAKAEYRCLNIWPYHFEYYDAEMSVEDKVPATCLTNGERHHTATYDGHVETKIETIYATGHNWGSPTYEWTDNFKSCTATRVCLDDASHVETETVSSSYDVFKESTVEENGIGRFTANFENECFIDQIHDISLDKLYPEIYNGEEPIFSDDGKTVTYGLYPQNHVTDEDLIKELEKLIVTEANGWYKYHGEYYHKLVAIANPIDYTNHYLFDDETYIIPGNTYWFKCEPITWHVLSKEGSHYSLFSDLVLDKSNYASCDNFLSGSFYDSTFSLNDSYLTEFVIENGEVGKRRKVFLPETKDVMSQEAAIIYGIASEFARSRGLYLPNSHGGYSSSTPVSYYARSNYWTRSKANRDDVFYYITEGKSYHTGNVANVFGVRPMIRIDTELEKEISYGTTPVFSEDGKYVEYGLYPKSHVYDQSLVEKLEQIEAPEANGWYLFNDIYYSKLENVTFNGNAYFSSGDRVINGGTYWFKCEPVKWAITNVNDNKYELLSTETLGTHQFYANEETRIIDGVTIYPNNYFYSDVRQYLNNDFYNQLFGLNSDYIVPTTYDSNSDNVVLYDYPFFREHTEFSNCTISDYSLAKKGSEYGDYYTRSGGENLYVYSMGCDDNILNRYRRVYTPDFIRPAITIEVTGE